MATMWIDTHCHLDAAEFGPGHAAALVARARAAELGVRFAVIPAVARANFDTVRLLAHRLNEPKSGSYKPTGSRSWVCQGGSVRVILATT